MSILFGGSTEWSFCVKELLINPQGVALQRGFPGVPSSSDADPSRKPQETRGCAFPRKKKMVSKYGWKQPLKDCLRMAPK